MAHVAVLHNTLDFRGGADVVCLRTCEALADDHDVALFTASETDPAHLADRFGVEFAGVDVRTPPAGRPIATLLSRAAPRVGPQLALRSVLLRRFFLPAAAGFDLAVSTANELSLPLPSVQYVHYPQFHLRRRRRRGSGDDGDASLPGTALNECWTRLAAPTGRELRGDDATLLANSAWTADVVADTYGTRPDVLYPPVDSIPCERSWEDREDGVVVVGRIAPDKRILDAIRVVDAVRDRGRDLHLHVVGTASPAYRRYVERVVATAAERPHVTLHRDVTRRRLESLLCRHKYGLNMKKNEHFGMAVAEYVAAAMVAFAPDSGGQREVLDGRTDRLFESPAAAVDRLLRATEADEPSTLDRDRFGADRFAAGVRRVVDDALD
jgi:glycosyltransferase involved in cell wall biosynthesis